MRKYITELLQEIDNNTENLAQYKDNTALKVLFQYAFLPEKKFDLPEGEPPFKKDASPMGMSPVRFESEFRRFYIFEKTKDLSKVRKELIFIQMLESIHPEEAKILIAVKDQNLNKLYTNITADVLSKYGFIPEKLKDEDVSGGQLSKKS